MAGESSFPFFEKLGDTAGDVNEMDNLDTNSGLIRSGGAFKLHLPNILRGQYC